MGREGKGKLYVAGGDTDQMFVEKIGKWEAVRLGSVSKEINRSVFIYARLLSLHRFGVKLLHKDYSFHGESLAFPCKP